MSKELPSTNFLAPYAASADKSLGRVHAEPQDAHRNPYQRDRDRIIHANAFRRLMYKTQVFVNFEGDMYRTRLTHSLEVAQIGRSIALALNLNEALTEAICLAHDLGHTPFGHAGQDALNTCMRDYGGFEHNFQSLRTVDELEQRYASFKGLNLMFETREGILKHCSRRNAKQLGELGQRFLRREQACLEAQIADIADAIAYNNHDVDDGLRAEILHVEGLCETELFAEQCEKVLELYPGLNGSLLHNEIIRRMINSVVSDLIKTSTERISVAAPEDIYAVRKHPEKLIALSEGMLKKHLALKKYLFKNFYRHPKIAAMNQKAENIIATLFRAYFSDPELLPKEHLHKATYSTSGAPDEQKARAIADYIAGMTDRFAQQEFDRLATQ
ncbi:MAG: deoxyguanosinetriphosphate triphosphohydrolase [Gammaproteobacteria bacterium]|nr:deoxyguanosinetriphosphate triphosphohydrolase [Gammaproteobacteria bacterium]NNC97931.1 deoxyguanosinetriphosphate triphosphohydrolase [Gammaproteobacteria bacterium]NNM14271.1 deoxyguanosinetriphosphate triphosphohydrolase [Gammaproteobacteria bacterium]